MDWRNSYPLLQSRPIAESIRPCGSDSDGQAGGNRPRSGRPQSASRGRGRGRGWNRSSRGRAARGRGGRVRLPPLQRASPGAAKAALQQLTPAELMRAVESSKDRANVGQPLSPPVPGRVGSFNDRPAAELSRTEEEAETSSSDSELEALQEEVKKFEAMVESKLAPGHQVPAFQKSLLGSSRLDNEGLDMQVKRQMLDKDEKVRADRAEQYARERARDDERLRRGQKCGRYRGQGEGELTVRTEVRHAVAERVAESQAKAAAWVDAQAMLPAPEPDLHRLETGPGASPVAPPGGSALRWATVPVIDDDVAGSRPQPEAKPTAKAGR